MKTKLMMFIAAGLILAGCDTYSAQQYQSNPENVIALQKVSASGKRASVGSVKTAEGVATKPPCRLAGPLDIGGGLPISSVIKQALQSELLAGNAYSSRGTPINVVVTQLTPDSFTGKWTIGLNVASPKGQGYSVKTVHGFRTSFTAVSACRNTAEAFNRALAKTINAVVTHPRFRSLL